MGESSTPRRPTHDTNTSRRQVNAHTHINNINNNNTSSKQSKYKRTMKITGLIASTLMLLLAVMASTASARSIAFPEPQYCCNAYTAECESCKQGVSVEEFCRTDPTFPECPIEQFPICCNAYNAKCESCKEGVSEDEFCGRDPHSHVCPQKPTKPSHPDNCYSTIWNTEIMHGEMGAKKCCWYGGWKSKSKCEKKTSHPDNCYSTIWNKEVMHGEMGAKKCCWKGDWESKSKCK